MTDHINNIIVTHLVAIRGDIADLRSRVSSVETTTAAMRRDIADFGVSMAGMQVSMDRLVGRFERIETRLGLIEEP